MNALLQGNGKVQTAARLCTVLGTLLGVCAGAQADFSVTGTYTPTLTGYFYDLSVTNNGADDLLLVSLFQTGTLTTISDESAPAGFQITSSSDGTTGYVDFSAAPASSSLFAAGATVGQFRFNSATLLAPNPQAFGLDINGVDTDNGLVGNATITIVPEPGLIPFAGVAALALCGVLVRRRLAR